MTTHPPGHPTGPTGPGPGRFRPSEGPDALDTFIDAANADILATLDEVVDTEADLARLKAAATGRGREFAVGDVVVIADNELRWVVSEILADHPKYPGAADLGPYATLKAADGSGDSWAALEILRHALPTLADQVRDTERLLAQALHVLGREIDPASLPGGDPDRSRYYRQAAALHIAAAQRELGRLAAAHLPAVGSAVELPARSPAEVEQERFDRGGFNPHADGGLVARPPWWEFV